MRRTIFATAVFLLTSTAFAAGTAGFKLDVLVGGNARPEYFSRGTVYVEALKESDYELRITNPTPYRIAVALSVDGLNTIDAKHTEAWSASKWVLDPYESTTISGWQVSDEAARRFYFTGEKKSYAAKLGQTENLGVIEAVFYRERPRVVHERRQRVEEMPMERKDEASAVPRAPSATGQSKASGLSNDYAATGMGGRTDHRIESVYFDLDPDPVASVRIRYEFHQQLVKMGILEPSPSPIERRERARGFGSYCPQVN